MEHKAIYTQKLYESLPTQMAKLKRGTAGGNPVKLIAIDFEHMLIGTLSIGAVLAAFLRNAAIGGGFE